MAPSAIPKEDTVSDDSSPSDSRYLSSSPVTPLSAPSSSLPSSKGGKRDGGSTMDKDTPMADSPMDSREEIFSSHHSLSEDEQNHDDRSDKDHHRHGDSGEIIEPVSVKPQRSHRPRIRSSARYSNENHNSNSTNTVPEVKYAGKAGILLPNNAKMDRGGGNGGTGIGDAVGQILPGETYYLPPQNPGNRASGQYQTYPGYTSNGNGVNGNGNYLNGGYGPNGASSPQPGHAHPYNGNGAQPLPHYPFHYPHQAQPPPQPGGRPYYFDPHGQYVTSNNTSENGLNNVRGEEIGIVLVVLLLWVGAIILFFNRWGKIRMLEPYQPKFCEAHRPSCPMADVSAITNIPVCRERTFSKYNLSTEMLAGPNGSPHFVKCNYHGIPSADPAPGFSGLTTGSGIPGGLTIPGGGFPGGGSTGMLNSHRNSIMTMNHHHHHQRPRQNSVFVTSPSSQVNFYGSDTALKSSSRKTKSAVDLPTLVLSGEFIDNVRRNSKNSITQL